MPSLLALDCSTHVGWSLWASAEKPVKFGTWHAPKTWAVDAYGRRLKAFHDWLCDHITRYQPDMLAFESPVLPRAGMKDMKTTEDTMRLLIGLVAVAELVAELRGLRCFEVHGSTVKVALAGTSRFPSTEKNRIMVSAAHARNFMVADGHQADSCGVGLVVYDMLSDS